MGQYFRQWVVREGLMTENYLPKDGEIRVYANSMQRTIATAQYFSSGFLPIANVKVNRRFRSSRMDSIFHPQLTDVVGAMALNIRYDGSEVTLVTGISLKSFSLDKNADRIWDTMMERFLASREIGFETMT